MTLRPRTIFLMLLCLVVLAVPLVAANSEEAANTTLDWVFRWLNFALVFGGGYLLVKKGSPAFRGRADKIAAGIAEAAHTHQEAESQLLLAEEKLRRLEQEAAELRAAAQRESAAEAERIRALGREEAQKTERAAQAEIAAAERAARLELKELAARLAVERAEAALRRRISARTQAGLFRYFVQSLARNVN